jgi:hypothetical protein
MVHRGFVIIVILMVLGVAANDTESPVSTTSGSTIPL